MRHQAYEAKKTFVTQTLSRCIAGMYPRVARLEYHLHDNDATGREDEVCVIRFVCGITDRVDVTGLDLRETTDAVLAVFAPEVA